MTGIIWNGLKHGLRSIKKSSQPGQLLLIAKSGAAGHRESFSSTGAVMVKTKKQKKEIQRQRLKAEEAKSAARTSIQLKQKPDPILGYSTLIPNGHLKWEQCELSKLIIKKEDVWAGRIAPLPQDQRLNNPPADRPANDNSDLLPLVLNFGLDENAHQKAILFDGLPKMKELVMRKNTPLFDPSLGASSSSSSPSSDSSSTETFEQNEEDLKKLRLMRILDLRNSNSQGIDKFIKLRILKAFSPKDPHRPEKLDPGCSEVQAAMITYRIHTVLEHAWQNRRDKDSKRHLSDLVMKRMKILKYLKRTNPKSYFGLLPRIGLEPRYLKDELIVRAKLPLRPGESLD
ncbi:hypothetical protein PCANC_08065 [Puccinia coronata f. sp. avenae]|uniref:Ribosomal protein S15 n=1 Tax=Puccinia coronata f. sp. avenae TaxID=200324 RepID=A0A2N5SYU4_9BASI|nr:hypothetical protein PCASD_14987 [Puccinia coronata f. sp. avenae]PLW18407.1 hypothetical protein PCANC_08849 [Puccinia coronata f. sp. avenae]PLW45742.1 hypothetical protein PCANC_08065 [Puccinia coronata f. sp. avenae]PLW49920.1 hypothetical protein PCASD_01303 [Puccinia coronata f. sp. avenae]